MNTLSIIIVIVATIGIIYGYRRGIVREAVSLIAIILGIIACRLFSTPATCTAAKLLGLDSEGSSISHYTASVVGCLAIFIAVWAGVWLIGRVIRGAVHAVKLGVLDSSIGALYCSGKWTLILSLLLNIVYLIAPGASMWGADPPQGIIKACLAFAPWLFGIVSSSVQ